MAKEMISENTKKEKKRKGLDVESLVSAFLSGKKKTLTEREAIRITLWRLSRVGKPMPNVRVAEYLREQGMYIFQLCEQLFNKRLQLQGYVPAALFVMAYSYERIKRVECSTEEQIKQMLDKTEPMVVSGAEKLLADVLNLLLTYKAATHILSKKYDVPDLYNSALEIGTLLPATALMVNEQRRIVSLSKREECLSLCPEAPSFEMTEEEIKQLSKPLLSGDFRKAVEALDRGVRGTNEK